MLGIDPSGNFIEGKGTTGYCILNCKENKIEKIGSVFARDSSTQIEYWNNQLVLINEYIKKYGKDTLAVSIEDYRLYASKATNQINSTFETIQLIGILKYYMYVNGIHYKMRLATIAKNRFNDDVLVKKNYITKKNKSYYCNYKATALLDHERDALRHALYFSYFENN